MMTLIIGGSHNGKREFAETIKQEREIGKLNTWIREELEKETPNIIETILQRIQNKHIIILADEVGAGIVPMDKKERVYRELVGRCSCEIAKISEDVYRVYASIPMRIK